MPPSTSSHRRTRSRADANLSSPEAPPHSPSRQPNKKRRVEADTEQTPIEDFQVNSVIQCLQMPPNDVMVAIDHANDKNARDHRDGVTAYAKMSGLNWTYYVKNLRVVIGRPPDARPGGALDVNSDVDIDLGPSKLISRQHAIIEYDTTGQRNWVLEVLGRNGVKVDDETYKKGSTVHLKSGNMLEIAGVQMLWFLPDQVANIYPALLAKATALRKELSDDVMHDVDTDLSATNPFVDHIDSALASGRTKPLPRTDGGIIMSPVDIKSEAGVTVSFPRLEGSMLNYHRGIMLESTSDVDYAIDSAKDIKPPYSYATLIAQAILSSEEEKLTLAQIYLWIQDRYAFYRHAASGWQNSIRHNLSLNKAFQKIPRRTDEPGKGMKWQVADDARDEFTKKANKGSRGKGSSQPSSPALDSRRGHALSNSKHHNAMPSSSNFSTGGDDEREGGFRKFKGFAGLHRSVTPPPFGHRVTPKEAYTPDRGSRKPAPQRPTISDDDDDDDDDNEDDNMGDITSTQDFPAPRVGRTVASSSPYIDEEHEHTILGSTVTPAPQRQHPMLAPPSISQQLPSSFLPTSSPAPFWKFMNLSTPARSNDFSSPIKAPALQSSSPPQAPLGSRLRDVSSPITSNPAGGDIFGTPSRANGLKEEVTVDVDEEVDDLQGFDLSKGFPSIGKYHASQAAARVHGSGLNGHGRFR